ncbi:MAG: HAD-IIIA family hydrolase [Saprospiraceae bacterium]|nr:HAD-IIIA family hydrolase [Saprospiraceae bacterium]MCF8248600.1 HAD-IIIA family hydrolase [Saprospiraceae bacterium]MCF8281038.1 HAD-IIIA family hydrolase [Bacteroidales bacterium]MCF8310333.1 HAD-IIIA family hydrolase [Saprospiraceae bacterium]MCF8442086.1 HAD-IIIA family hydrolase [Saprospiraceae bacterium]
MNTPDSNERFHLAGNVLSRFKDIHTFIFDVDGVLTNGNVLVTESGELLRSMSVRDGQALRMAVDEGFRILILTKGKSAGVTSRLRELGIQDIITNLPKKLKAYEEFLDAYDLDEEGILYMGDDLPDYEVMRRVGLPTCPNDAVPEIREICHYISPLKGGEGCVRDVIEKVMKLNGVWKV